MPTSSRDLPWWVPLPAFAAGALLGCAGAHYMPQWLGTSSRQALQTPGCETPPLTPGARSTSRALSPTPSISSTTFGGVTPPRCYVGTYAARANSGAAAVGPAAGERLKVALLVRGDLGWGSGTLGAMCASVLLALFKKLYKGRDPLLSIWESQRALKSVFEVPDEATLSAVVAAAKEEQVPTHTIMGSGGLSRTTSAAAGSDHTSSNGEAGAPVLQHSLTGSLASPAARTKTIAAIGPGPASVIDALTSQLMYLK